MLWLLATPLLYLTLTAAQQVGNLQPETHPGLQWTQCTTNGNCSKIDGELTLDANWRWLHKIDDYRSCYEGQNWNAGVCNSDANCTAICALEGAQYKEVYGVVAGNDSFSQRLRTNFEFAYNIGSRLFLLESKNRYQTFTLLNNELAFDVDLSTVECGINSALFFVPMDPDGGQARFPTNKAGAEYGTGFCDSTCTRELKFIGGTANMEGWSPSATDEFGGKGNRGSCCPQLNVWTSNAHSFALSTHICPEYYVDQGFPFICDGSECLPPNDRGEMRCDRWGCSYNPYRMGNREFYGKGKRVDTARKFTVVTRFTETNITQFFIQDGQKIDVPVPVWDGLPKEAGLSADMCGKQLEVFIERDAFGMNGGWDQNLQQLLTQPMVLSTSINVDHYAWNIWLDSTFPLEAKGELGFERGDCIPYENNDPFVVQNSYGNATVTWSNIRFGPIGTTVKVE
ncbi:Exoglucanase 1 [Madurella mycetomatis]|uniref:Glucanase n=1 Tax=Madurella mycetomatis TaxID=100816 RepID=A0A175WBL6_9PEZI|nr:Exoglucanase 1 [Madurella mycetomatis]